MAYFFSGLGVGILLILGIFWYNIGRHRRIPSLTKYVVFSIAILLLYTVAEFVEVTVHGMSHDTLTTCLYSVFGGEILSCALIKIFKLREENRDE